MVFSLSFEHAIFSSWFRGKIKEDRQLIMFCYNLSCDISVLISFCVNYYVSLNFSFTCAYRTKRMVPILVLPKARNPSNEYSFQSWHVSQTIAVSIRNIHFSLGSFFFLDQEAIACLDREEPELIQTSIWKDNHTIRKPYSLPGVISVPKSGKKTENLNFRPKSQGTDGETYQEVLKMFRHYSFFSENT